MKAIHQEHKHSNAETVIEIFLSPLLFAVPFIVLLQIFKGVGGAPSIPWLMVSTLVVTAGTIGAFYFLRLHLVNRSLPYFGSIFLAQTIFFVCFFIVFESQESFRLPQQTLFQITVALCVFLFAVQSAWSGRIAWRKNHLNLPIALSLGFAFVSFAFSPSFWVSMKDYIELLCIGLLFWLIVNMWDARRHFALAAVLALLVGTFMSFIGVAQHFNFNEIYGLGHNLDPFSTLGNKNYVAELLAMVSPFALGMAIITPKLRDKILIWLGIEFMLIVIIVAETRGSWIGLIMGLVVLLLYGLDNFGPRVRLTLLLTISAYVANALLIMFLSQNQILFGPGPIAYKERFLSMVRVMNSMLAENPKIWIAAGIGILISVAVSQLMLRTRTARLAAVALILSVAGVTFAFERDMKDPVPVQAQQTAQPTTYQVPLDDSIASRRFIYGGSWQMVLEHPLGTGIGIFKVRYLPMLKDYLRAKGIIEIPGFFKDVNAKEAHNEYLHTLAEQGPIGLLLLILFIVRLIQYFYQVYYQSRDPFTRMVVLGAFSGLSAIGASAMLGFPFRIVPTAVVCCVLLALIVFGDARNRHINDAAFETPDQNPDMWRVFSLSSVTRAVIPGAALIFFALTTFYSFSWQKANILMKQGDAILRAAESQSDPEQIRKLTDQALRTLQESLVNDPTNGETLMKLGMFYQSMAQREPETSDKREEFFDKAIDNLLESMKYFELPQSRLNLGAAYFHKGMMLFTRARMAGNDAQSRHLFKSGYEYFDKAEKEFQSTLRIYPNYSLPHFNLALIQYEYAQYATERENQKLRQALILRRDAEAMDSAAKKQILEQAVSLDKEASDLHKQAMNLYTKAEERFNKTLEIEPTLVVANFKLGISYERMGKPGLARKQYEKTIQLTASTPTDNATLADAYYNLGILYSADAMKMQADAAAVDISREKQKSLIARYDEMKDKATQMFKQAIDHNYGHIKAHNNLANILYQQGNEDQALYHYEQALSIDPNYPEAKLNLILITLSQAQRSQDNFKFQESLRYAQEMLSQNPQGSQLLKVLRIIGVCQRNLGNLQEANNYLTQLVTAFRGRPEQNDPDYPMGVLNLAETRLDLGDAQSAVNLAKQVAANPVTPINQLRALHRLGVWEYKLGRSAESLTHFKQAMVFMDSYYNDPEFADMILQYADKMLQQGRTPDSLNLLEKYYKTKPIQNPGVKSAILFTLGRIYAGSGRINDAKNAFQTVINSNWPQAQQAQQELNRLRNNPAPQP